MSRGEEQPRVEKGPDAFRTISEVAEDLDLPQHVLRFWETRFPQIRPLKRGGGRRYYRPDDVELLRGIRHLLYSEGYTIRGVQRILREEGPRYVQAIWRDVEVEREELERVGAGERRHRRQSGPDADGEPDETPSRGGAIGGLLGLLPSRQQDEEPDFAPTHRSGGPRRASEPEFLELPPRPEFGPDDARPPAREARWHGESPVPGSAQPGRHHDDDDDEPRPSFPFRTVTPEPAIDAGDPLDEGDDASPEASGFRAEERVHPQMTEAPSAQLAPGDVEQLEDALHELQECRRILDGARR